MRKDILVVVAGAVALSVVNVSSEQQLNPDPPARVLAIHATDLGELRTWDDFVVKGVRSGGLRLRSVDRDPALPTRVVERFEQFHNGVPIWGADVVRDSEGSVSHSIFGMLSPDLSLSTQPRLSAEGAMSAMLAPGGVDSVVYVEPRLVILRLDNGEHRLAYTGVVSRDNDIVRVFVDATSGGTLMQYSEIQRQDAAVGTGTGVLGDRKKLSVETNAGGFIAFDRHRPPIIQTFDARGNLARAKALLNRTTPYTMSDLARDEDNVWTDPAVVDGHVHVSWTYDYYYKRFGRSGLDDRNGPVNILVNPVLQANATSVPVSDMGTFVLNAFFSPFAGPNGTGVMMFGSGAPSNVTWSDGRTYTHFSGALDIAAHELTHAVTFATSNLVYMNESGALNEAFSDIMAKGVEFFYHPSGTGSGQADYVLGKDIARSARAGVPSGNRSLADPGMFGDPDHYSRRYIGESDNGGVHTNSGIANHAFYLAVEGGTNRTSSLNVQGVGAANREQIEKVFYRAFTLLMPRHATFLIARSATVQAARDLYGAGSPAERAVMQAWNAVGIPDPASVGTFSGSVGAGAVVIYRITMNASGRYEAALTWNSPDSTDLDLYLTPVGCFFTSPSCVLSRSISPNGIESVGWPVSSGQQYWLTIHNFAGSAATFTVQHWISSVRGLAVTHSLVPEDER
jgi:thermolysin